MMVSKASISFGEAYEISIQVTSSEEVNNRNTRVILDAFTNFALREFDVWDIKIKTEYKDYHSSEQKVS